jgi:hypothetical protein
LTIEGVIDMITNYLNSEDVSWFPYNGEDNFGGEVSDMINSLKEKI